MNASVTHTIRMPESLKARLEHSAANQNMSISQFVVHVLEQHYLAAGFASREIVVSRGRNLEIRIAPINHVVGQPSLMFFLDDSMRKREIGAYKIGISAEVESRFLFEKGDVYQAIEEIGIALLHFYNRLGRNLGQLSWKQFPNDHSFRLLEPKDLKTNLGIHLMTLEEFLLALAEGQWTDRCDTALSTDSLPNIDESVREALKRLWEENKQQDE